MAALMSLYIFLNQIGHHSESTQHLLLDAENCFCETSFEAHAPSFNDSAGPASRTGDVPAHFPEP